MAACACSGSALGLYILGADYECDWPRPLRAVLYFCLLIYLFLGVAIVANIFMEAIEVITAKKKDRVKSIEDGGDGKEKETILVWNPTVANLTLLALGSSAPEILLALIEVLVGKFKAGPLGAGTIVGSAAFNLLVIIAICVMAIPSGQVRRIKETSVYAFTAVVSVFAYLWVLIILVAISPDVVEVWEAAVTLLFFPMLVYVAWQFDVGMFSALRRKFFRRRVMPSAEEPRGFMGSAAIKKWKSTQFIANAFSGRTSEKPVLRPREAMKLIQQIHPDGAEQPLDE